MTNVKAGKGGASPTSNRNKPWFVLEGEAEQWAKGENKLLRHKIK